MSVSESEKLRNDFSIVEFWAVFFIDEKFLDFYGDFKDFYGELIEMRVTDFSGTHLIKFLCYAYL